MVNAQYYKGFVSCDVLWKSYDHTEITLDMFSKCRFCDCELNFLGSPGWILYCKNEKCNWWLNAPLPHPEGFRSVFRDGKWASLKNFDLTNKDIPTDLLADFLKNNPKSIVHTNSTAFEKLVCDILKEKYGDVDFFHVGKPGMEGKTL